MTIPFRLLSYFRVFLCSACVIGFCNQSVQAQTETFYKNKTIRVIVGFTPGGFYDRWARLISRYMPKYHTGQPGDDRAEHARRKLRYCGQLRLQRCQRRRINASSRQSTVCT